MKKKLLIILLTLCTVLALGSLVALGAGSSEEPSLKIEAANLSFEDSVFVLYAISHEGVAYDGIQMLFWTEPQEEYTVGTETYSKEYFATNVNVNGQICTVFKNNELRAKNMADNIYARAYARIDGKDYYSEVSKYSILQYACNKLGKTGTMTTNENLRTMLVDMLTYGASAQKHFDHNADRPADGDFYQVKTEGGVLEDGFSKGLYLPSETATLRAPEECGGAPFAAWKNAAGETVATTPTATVTGFVQNETYTATYAEKTVSTDSQGLEYTLSSDGTYYAVSGIGTCTNPTITIPQKHEGLPVKEIGARAFTGATTLSGIVIPMSLISIGESAFEGCTSLTLVTYTGTKNEWESLAIGAGNTPLLTATKKYESNRTEWMPF